MYISRFASIDAKHFAMEKEGEAILSSLHVVPFL